ncbi:F-box domain-containing protein [Mycena sanguinolenta]|uniref:F-box domain-containing protein n=1 Tax=Mycena sanguinolenta TaxID=230812 RepID=A0A8H6Z7M6_9AGAR|nr:F-box domain-containing protein [Mycena sanguinolenta]
MESTLLEQASALTADILKYNPSHRKQGNNAHLAVLSPACRLPDDVVRTIFMATLPSTRNPGISPDEAPLLLVRIWKPWRDIALQTPRLWASIHIVVTSLAIIPRLTEVVMNWLNRSGALPLDICLLPSERLRFRTTNPQSGSISLLLSALIQTSRRWRKVRFFLSKNDAETLLQQLSRDDVPLLKVITIASPPATKSNEHILCRSLSFLAAPSIRRLTLTAAPGNASYRAPAAWGNLTYLKIVHTSEIDPATVSKTDWAKGSIPAKRALEILRQCTALRLCELSLAGEVSLYHFTSFSLPCLEDLTIHDFFGKTDDTTFFKYIELPNLRFYSFEAYHWPAPQAIPVPSTTLSSLQHLQLSPGPSSETILAILARTTRLEELFLRVVPAPHLENADNYDNHFLRALTDVAAPICPTLRSLEIRSGDKLTETEIIDFVSRRISTGVFMRFVTLLNGSQQLDVAAHLHDVLPIGFELIVRYTSPYPHLGMRED